MEQLELFDIKDLVLAGLSFEQPKPGSFVWYEEWYEDYINPRSGYCYVQELDVDFNFVCYDAENERHLVLRHHEIKRVDELREWTPKKQ